MPELQAANPAARAVVLTSTTIHRKSHAIEREVTAVLDKMPHLGQVAQAVRRVLAGNG